MTDRDGFRPARPLARPLARVPWSAQGLAEAPTDRPRDLYGSLL